MKIRLIIPNYGNTENGGRDWSPIKDYGREIASIAGGFTATQATGGWIDGSNLLVAEPVTVFDCYMTSDCPAVTRTDWELLARKIARELRQECVYLEIDGEVEFVTA